MGNKKRIITGIALCMMMTGVLSGCPNRGTPVPRPSGREDKDPAKQNGQAVQQASVPQYPAPLLKSPNTLTVDVLAYRAGQRIGVMIPAKITVGPNTDNEPNVAIAGDLSGGQGGSWRAGVWMSAHQASTSVGRDLTDYAISSRGYGFIDGASASALFTATMMAAMMGLPIKSEFTMTGTVNPDGTVGPVGGIPNKFMAALQKGKKILGYPIGQRFARDEHTKELVDLQELAAQAGGRAVEVATVYDAYQLLTGEAFPHPRPLSTSEMSLPRSVHQRLGEYTQKWSKVFATYGKGFMAQKVEKIPAAADRMNTAYKYMKKSSELLQEGSVAAAYDFAQRGGAWAFTSFWYARFLRLAVHKQFKEIYSTTMQLKKSEKKVFDQLQALRIQRPGTVDQLVAVISAYEQLVEAWAYTENGNILLKQTMANIQKMQKTPPKKDPTGLMFEWFYDTALKYSLAEIKQAKAGNFLTFHVTPSAPYAMDPARLRRVAKVFLAAAQANLIYFEEIFVPMFVKALGKSPAIVKNILKSQIGKYLLATLCLRFPQFVLSKAWGENAVETAFAQVAGSMGSYFNSSMLITKYYSLKLNIVDKIMGKGTVQSVPRLKALVSMIGHAEKSVRINAALAQKHAGTVPTSAKVFYHIGMTMKEMMPSLKIKALEMFWRASMECQLAVMLSRKS